MTGRALQPNAEWEGILREGEEILWQGKPDPGFYLHPSRMTSAGTSVLFLGVSAFMAVSALAQGEPLFFLFLLLFGGFSSFFFYDSVIRPNRERRYSFYTLTNQRAIVGLALPRRTPELKKFDLFAGKAFEYIPGRLGSIVFDRVYTGTKVNKIKQYYAVGFIRFVGSDEVWQMIQELKNPSTREAVGESEATR